MMKLNRKSTKIVRSENPEPIDRIILTPQECLSFIWELTEEIFSLSGEHNAQSRLQRNVVSIIKRKG